MGNTSVFKLLGIFFLFGYLLNTTVGADTNIVGCDRLLFAINEGKPVDGWKLPLSLKIQNLFSSDEKTFFELGKGKTGKVYLTKPKNSPMDSFSIKKYKWSPLLDMDLRAFQNLKPFEEELGFKIPNVSRLSGTMLKMDYVPGKDLLSIIFDPDFSATLKESLVQKYNENLNLMVNLLYSKFSDITDDNDKKITPAQGREAVTLFFDQDGTLTQWITPNTGYAINFYTWKGFIHLKNNYFTIILKPDNIIVSPYSLDMTLVDPQ